MRPRLLVCLGLLLLGASAPPRAHHGEEGDPFGGQPDHALYELTLERAQALRNSRVEGLVDLKTLGPDQQAAAIRYCDGLYFITRGSGQVTVHWEFDLRLKTDSSARGPRRDTPVLVPRGSTGDRWFLIFAAPQEISRSIREQC